LACIQPFFYYRPIQPLRCQGKSLSNVFQPQEFDYDNTEVIRGGVGLKVKWVWNDILDHLILMPSTGVAAQYVIWHNALSSVFEVEEFEYDNAEACRRCAALVIGGITNFWSILGEIIFSNFLCAAHVFQTGFTSCLQASAI
jgi:hypothetical protein